MINTKNLTFQYHTQENFSFPDLSCHAGQSLLITGQSGVGKTTLLHLLAGIQKPQTGEIFIENQNICALRSKKLDSFRGKNIGLILQESHFINALTVIENLEFSSWFATGHKLTQKCLDLLNDLDILSKKDKFTHQLSVGQQQRLSIARSLVASPKLLLADEPTSSLDDQNTIMVAELLENLSKKYGTALIIVTHDQRLKTLFSNHLNLEKC